MQTVQFIQITPEQLQNAIIQGVNSKLEELKKEFQPKQPTEYLTRQEVADLLQINLTTLWNWTNKGKLIAYGIGSRVYYKRHEVEKGLIEQPSETFKLMLEALQNLENDNNQIPPHAWEMVQNAIKKAIG